jgi:murein DD-endopeptidase MepM/ murein hydrolase activator NlpD
MAKTNKKIKMLEKNIEKHNSLYLSNMINKKEMKNKLGTYQKTIEHEKTSIKRQITETKKNFQTLLINYLDQSDSLNTLLEKNILKKIIAKNLRLLIKSRQRLELLEKQLVLINKEFETVESRQEQLSKLIIKLENNKKNLTEHYYQKENQKQKWSARFKKLKGKLIIGTDQKKRNKIRQKFSSPIGEYTDFHYKKKGITFTFKGLSQVTAPRGGKVVHSGKLSTFGNLVIIDHGGSTRSLVLGKYGLKIKKGEKVNKGDIIGYTPDNEDGKIYFEIRKKDKVENTILYMDNSFISSIKLSVAK